MKLTFRNAPHHLYPLIENKECPASSLKLFGYPLIVRNIMMAQKFMSVDTICMPDEFSDASRLIQDYFPTINLNEFCDDDRGTPVSAPSPLNYHLATTPVQSQHSDFEIPINSLIHNSSYSCLSHNANHNHDNANHNNESNNLAVDVLTYPWDFLNAVQDVLHNEITHTVISPMATVAKSSIINGPCIIEDDVVIDDFCKIVGPIYIGSGSFIGMSSLIRKSMMGINTRIGFNCEVAKTYFEGHDRIAHQNVILDSIIGRNVWFGGYSGTANVLLDRKNVRYQIDDNLVDTGTDHFGAVVGNNCTVGASVIILPGRQVQPNTIIQAGTILGKKDTL
jgi:UDP-N-acetylglucosamine diphosphorylase / glucose-1-phosphate thymidylyltransferase / UDP-N-acetylgalactosamine diphosphorylase / glucosamine-1-phosphate N-acetyltransferase / galactosamine-1-phosphate N-acetyltransferase